MHLSVVPQNRFGDFVEAALRVEQSTTAMYQSGQESKRSTPSASQQSFGQYNKKRNKGRGYRGRGVGRGAISSQGSVRPPVASSGTRAFLPFFICVRSDTMESLGDLVQCVSTVARKAISLGSAPS